MKKVNYILALLIISVNSFGQAPNDDCSTATFLGNLDGSWSGGCYDGTIYWSTMAYDSNAIATPSFPYYSMSGCLGYTNSTTTNADDIWFRFGSWPCQSIQFRWWSNDTTHINFYNGTSCSTLLASGCFTYLPSYFDTIISIYVTNDTLNQNNYIQFSGTSPGKKVQFSFCIKTCPIFTATTYGTVNVNTSIEQFNFQNSNVFTTPNPVANLFTLYGDLKNQSTIVLFNSFGQEVFRKQINGSSKTISVNTETLSNGIYYWKVISKDQTQANGKVVVIK